VHKVIGATHFELPAGDLAAFIVRVNVQPGVRIGPFKLSHSAVDRDALVTISREHSSHDRRVPAIASIRDWQNGVDSFAEYGNCSAMINLERRKR